MKIITRQERANSALERWKNQYPKDKFPDKYEIEKKLASLGSRPFADLVDYVIGNKSWTDIGECAECGASDKNYLVEISKNIDYERQSLSLCIDCLLEAVKLIICTKEGEK